MKIKILIKWMINNRNFKAISNVQVIRDHQESIITKYHN